MFHTSVSPLYDNLGVTSPKKGLNSVQFARSHRRENTYSGLEPELLLPRTALTLPETWTDS